MKEIDSQIQLKQYQTMKKLLVSLTAIALLSGCANFSQQVQTLEPPAKFQTDITWLGSRAKEYVSADNQAKIHNFAVQLQTTANLDLSALFALLPPTTGSIAGDLLLNSLKTTLQLVVNYYGAKNPTTLMYAHSGATGLLTNF